MCVLVRACSVIYCETDNIGGIRAIRDECDSWGQVYRGEMDRAHSTASTCS